MVNLLSPYNCDTVKKARSWLSDRGMEYQFHDFKKQGVPEHKLDDWLHASGWETLGEQQHVTDTASARKLALAQPSVIKRPVVEWNDGAVTVGFTAALFENFVAG